MAGRPCTRGSTIVIKSIIAPRSETPKILTWLVQTLLNVTKASVCASMVLARSFLANERGIATSESRICGMNARDSIRMPVWEGC